MNRERHHDEKDWWDKASIVSSFLSSVVIAVIGIAITTSLNRSQVTSAEATAKAQMALERLRADDQRKIEEGQLTAQLLAHLTSKNPMERAVAITALRGSLQLDRFDAVLGVLARSDPSDEVREAAIERLGESGATNLAPVLVKIARDPNRSDGERVLATAAVHRIEVSAGLPPGTLVLAAGAGAVTDPSGFTQSLLDGIGGAADANHDDVVSAAELATWVARRVPAIGESLGRSSERPVFSLAGADFPITGPSAGYREIAGIVVGISKYEAPYANLAYSAGEARQLHVAISSWPGATASKIRLFQDEAATRARIIQALDDVAASVPSDSLLIFYFSGMGEHSSDGRSECVLYRDGQKKESVLRLDEIKARLAKSKARSKVILLDTAFAGADIIRDLR